jgi:hypothetical protein
MKDFQLRLKHRKKSYLKNTKACNKAIRIIKIKLKTIYKQIINLNNAILRNL